MRALWKARGRHLSPKVWALETVFLGNACTVGYCMYGFDYKKPTRFWHNNKYFTGLMCDHKGKHTQSIGSGTNQVNTLNERYSIPPQLDEDVFECVDCALD